jgi:hypothetical protein
MLQQSLAIPLGMLQASELWKGNGAWGGDSRERHHDAKPAVGDEYPDASFML